MNRLLWLVLGGIAGVVGSGIATHLNQEVEEKEPEANPWRQRLPIEPLDDLAEIDIAPIIERDSE